MQHRQDNLLANRNLLPGMVSGQYAFRIRTLSQVVRYFSPPPLPLHSFIFVSGSHAVSG